MPFCTTGAAVSSRYTSSFAVPLAVPREMNVVSIRAQTSNRAFRKRLSLFVSGLLPTLVKAYLIGGTKYPEN